MSDCSNNIKNEANTLKSLIHKFYKNDYKLYDFDAYGCNEEKYKHYLQINNKNKPICKNLNNCFELNNKEIIGNTKDKLFKDINAKNNVLNGNKKTKITHFLDDININDDYKSIDKNSDFYINTDGEYCYKSDSYDGEV